MENIVPIILIVLFFLLVVVLIKNHFTLPETGEERDARILRELEAEKEKERKRNEAWEKFKRQMLEENFINKKDSKMEALAEGRKKLLAPQSEYFYDNWSFDQERDDSSFRSIFFLSGRDIGDEDKYDSYGSFLGVLHMDERFNFPHTLIYEKKAYKEILGKPLDTFKKLKNLDIPKSLKIGSDDKPKTGSIVTQEILDKIDGENNYFAIEMKGNLVCLFFVDNYSSSGPYQDWSEKHITNAIQNIDWVLENLNLDEAKS